MKNIEVIINCLLDICDDDKIEFERKSTDDDRATVMSVIENNIDCPYRCSNSGYCAPNELTDDETCNACKYDWLLKEWE